MIGVHTGLGKKPAPLRVLTFFIGLVSRINLVALLLVSYAMNQ